MRTLIDIKKHSSALARLVATVQLKEHGVTCYFESASQAIGLGYTRSEILEALNKDISKTADDLFNSQAIIKSIQNGRVVEFDSIYNTVEDVFGATYNKENGTITLSGVCFTIGGVGSFTKAELSALVLQSLFGIDKKELSGVLKTLTRYEETTDEIQKAILYPSTILADEMIAKITDQEVAFASFKKGMSYEQESEFNKVFNRTGVTGVIQNATYIDATGIKQLAPSHKRNDAKDLEFLLTAGRLKYVEAIECDGDGSLEKMTMLVNQVEKFKLNTKVKFTFKARKLGNLKATGVFFPSHLIVAEDVRNTSAVLHELGHLIHMISHNEDPFINYLIDKLTPMINLENVKLPLGRGAEYYYDSREVVARACEIGGLFARREGREAFVDDATFELIKSEQYYADQEGAYFNFTQFDETTKEELLALYTLFYETSPYDARDSRLDNFIKIDTNYRKVKKRFEDVLEDWARKQEKELRAIYSLVKCSTIDSIIKNRSQAPLDTLAMAIFSNISYCGNHNAKMTVSDWANAIEDKAGVIMTLLGATKENMNEKEYFMFILKMRKGAVWGRVRNTVLLNGFSDKFRPKIRKELQEIGATNYDRVKGFSTELLNDTHLPVEMLGDEEFVLDAISIAPDMLTRIEPGLVDLETLARWTKIALSARPENNRYSAFVINKALGDHLEFMDEAIEGNPMLISMAGDAYTNDAYRMLKYITDRASNFESLRYIGDELKDSVEFATPFVKINGQAIQYFSDRVKTELANAGEVNLIAMEIKKLEEADTKYRRKVARKTDNVKIIEFLAKDRNEEIRIEVAKRDITPPEILEGYAKRKSVWLKGAVAENANTPLPVLKAMIKTERDSHVFCSLAKNPNLTLSDFLVLVKKPERYTRLMVLCNQKIAGFMHGGKLSVLREIVKTALAGNEEYFAYEMKVSSEFKPSFELLEDMKNNISLYADMFPNMLLQVVNEMIECRFPHKVEKAEIVLVVPEDIALGGLFAS
jgi:hypothetical protein